VLPKAKQERNSARHTQNRSLAAGILKAAFNSVAASMATAHRAREDRHRRRNAIDGEVRQRRPARVGLGDLQHVVTDQLGDSLYKVSTSSHP
jgi:hypothetical protein